jgi:hypothetical protein
MRPGQLLPQRVGGAVVPTWLLLRPGLCRLHTLPRRVSGLLTCSMMRECRVFLEHIFDTFLSVTW